MSALPNHTIIHNNPVPDGAFCMHHYTPYWVYKEQGRTDEVASHDQDVMNMKAIKNGTPIQDASVLRVSAAMRQLLRPPFTVVVVPPSNTSATESGLHKVARALADMEGVENGAHVLKRTTPKPEAHNTEIRQVEATLTTLQVAVPEDVKGKRVLVLDDMCKTGNTIKATRQLLSHAGATHIEALVIGCTAGATPRE
jgi:predicted amidophosphoribosyltransferase